MLPVIDAAKRNTITFRALFKIKKYQTNQTVESIDMFTVFALEHENHTSHCGTALNT